jgi:hypothetical protein
VEHHWVVASPSIASAAGEPVASVVAVAVPVSAAFKAMRGVW